MKTRSVFCTVGTTLFEDFIHYVTKQEVLEWFAVEEMIDELVLQYGKGAIPLNQSQEEFEVTMKFPNARSLTVRAYRFKPSLKEDVDKAEFIMSHAGAGTIMESLKAGKKLIVIINTILMDNHQVEVAEALSKRKLIVVVDHAKLLLVKETRQRIIGFQTKPYPGGNKHDFPKLLNQLMGFCD